MRKRHLWPNLVATIVIILVAASTADLFDAHAAPDSEPAAASLLLGVSPSGTTKTARLIVASPPQARLSSLRIATEPQERLELLLTDGTSIALGGSTELVVEQYSADRSQGEMALQLSLERGIMRISNGDNSSRPATRVQTKYGIIELAAGAAGVVSLADVAGLQAVLLYGPELQLVRDGERSRIARPNFSVGAGPGGALDSKYLDGPLLNALTGATTFSPDVAFDVVTTELNGNRTDASKNTSASLQGGESDRDPYAKDYIDKGALQLNQTPNSEPASGQENSGTPSTGNPTPGSRSPSPNPINSGNPEQPSSLKSSLVLSQPLTSSAANKIAWSTTTRTPDAVVQLLPNINYAIQKIIAGHTSILGENTVFSEYGNPAISLFGVNSSNEKTHYEIVECCRNGIGVDGAIHLSGINISLPGAPETVINNGDTTFYGQLVFPSHSEIISNINEIRSNSPAKNYNNDDQSVRYQFLDPETKQNFSNATIESQTFLAFGDWNPVSQENLFGEVETRLSSRVDFAITEIDMKLDAIPPGDANFRKEVKFRIFGGERSIDAAGWFSPGFYVIKYGDMVALPRSSAIVYANGFIPGTLQYAVTSFADTQLLIAAMPANPPSSTSVGSALRMALQFGGVSSNQSSVLSVATGEVTRPAANDVALSGKTIGSARLDSRRASVTFGSELRTVSVKADDGPISTFGPTYANNAPSYFVASNGASQGGVTPLGADTVNFSFEKVFKATASNASAVGDYNKAVALRSDNATSKELTGYAAGIAERLQPITTPEGIFAIQSQTIPTDTVSSPAPPSESASLPAVAREVALYGLTAVGPAGVRLTVDPLVNQVSANLSLTRTDVGAKVADADPFSLALGGGTANSAYISDTYFAALTTDSIAANQSSIHATGFPDPSGALVTGEPLRTAIPNNQAIVEANDYLQWGLWLADITLPDGRRDHVHLGSWVAGQPTPAEALNNLAGTGVVGQYSGHAIGNVYDGARSALYTAVGSFNASVDFAQRRVAATISNFDGRNVAGTASYSAGGNQYQGSLVGNGIAGNMNGTFYGPKAQATGGSFSLNSLPGATNLYKAEGTFAATRKN